MTQTQFEVHTGEPVEDGVEKLKVKQLNYFAAISGIDDQFGRILQFLKENQFRGEYGSSSHLRSWRNDGITWVDGEACLV